MTNIAQEVEILLEDIIGELPNSAKRKFTYRGIDEIYPAIHAYLMAIRAGLQNSSSKIHSRLFFLLMTLKYLAKEDLTLLKILY